VEVPAEVLAVVAAVDTLERDVEVFEKSRRRRPRA
jgi:hypothetical protein